MNRRRILLPLPASPLLLHLLLTAVLNLAASHAKAAVAQAISIDHSGVSTGSEMVEEYFCFSEDGRFAAYATAAANLIPHDTNGIRDVIVHDCLLRSNVWNTSHSVAGAVPASLTVPLEFSADGRFLLFLSSATNFVPNVPPEVAQLYLRDLHPNVTHLVTVSQDGTNASAGPALISGLQARSPRLSSDGRFVGFASLANDLVPGLIFTNREQVFRRDMVDGVTELVSRSPSGEPLDRATPKFLMSGNGRFFAFESQATNAVSATNNVTGVNQVYWRDCLAGTNATVSIDINGNFCSAPASLAALSRDGRFVSFMANVTNLVADQNDDNGTLDVFIRDMFAGETWLVTRSTNGNTTGSRVSSGGFSTNGEWLLVAPTIGDLVPGIQDINDSSPDLYLHHLPTRSNHIVSVSVSGQTGSDGAASANFAFLSASGRFVLFRTDSGNLLAGATNRVNRLLLRDHLGGRMLSPLRSEPFQTLPYNRARFGITQDERYIFFLSQTAYDPDVVDNNLTADLFRVPLYAPKLFPPGKEGSISGEGLAFASYMLQSTTNMTEWLDVGVTSVDPAGYFQFTDSFPNPYEFYRVRAP